MKKSWLFLSCLALSINLLSCSSSDSSGTGVTPGSTTGGTGTGSGTGAPSSACDISDDCPTITCVCIQSTINSYQSCNVNNGVGVCGTCTDACANLGGIKTTNPGSGSGSGTGNTANCLDPSKGTSSAFRGSKNIGESCTVSNLRSDCASGVCKNDGTGNGFCTKSCSTATDCNGLACKSYTWDGNTNKECIPSSKEWCSN